MKSFKEFIKEDVRKYYKNPDQDTLHALAHHVKKKYSDWIDSDRVLRYVDHGGNRYVKSAAHTTHTQLMNKSNYQPHSKFRTGFYKLNKDGIKDEPL